MIRAARQDAILEEARALLGAAELHAPERSVPPLRALHHLACTGGTLIARALSVMPNVTLISEIDPFSPLDRPVPDKKPPFRPHDLLQGARAAARPVSDAVIERVFAASLAELARALAETGGRLVLRSHAHSQFCTAADPASRPSLQAMMARIAPVHAVVTVRHPLDSLLSLRAAGWVQYAATPEDDTAAAYAARYHAFLDAHEGLPVLRYEDFVAAPDTAMAWLCDRLDLAFAPGAETVIGAVRLSGDSGRTGGGIAARPRRAVPAALQAECAASPAWAALLERLGYDGKDGTGDG